MPPKVEAYLKKLMAKGMPESEAIRIGKDQGKIVQRGRHLGEGPTINVHKSKGRGGAKSNKHR